MKTGGKKQNAVKKLGRDLARLTIRVCWEGPQLVWQSLAHVNREICLGLLESDRIDLQVVPIDRPDFGPEVDGRFARLAERMFAPFTSEAAADSMPGADVHIRHHFPPRFERPDSGHYVLMQPWEYGYLPVRWIKPILENVTEVWCYSEYVRQVYLDSGIPESMLRVVPLGVDTRVFRPDAPPYVLTDEPGAERCRKKTAAQGTGAERPFVFLFCGGSIYRKGIDILLDAYSQAFSAYDNVCLLIKDTGTNTVYYGQNYSERIRALAMDHTRPCVVYLDRDLGIAEMAGVYTAADCLVAPYRGEGFCLPALEAMSCGRPAITTKGGPTDDFVDDAVGWPVPAAKLPMGDGPGEQCGMVGPYACVSQPWMFEVCPEELARTMREAFQDREEVRRRGDRAAAKVRAAWSWEHVAGNVLQRIEQIAAEKPPVRPDPAVPQTATVHPTSHSAPSGAMAKCKAPVAGDAAQAPALIVREAPTISLCMIARDEERVLAQCLESAKPWFDEIVLVDTGSTDRTMEIAREFGARVLEFPWCDDFSAARNVSLDAATSDWQMWMDCDDVLAAESGQKLRDLAYQAEDRTTGYIFPLHFPPAPGDFGYTVVDHVKLFRNDPRIRFEGRIHEQILEPINRFEGRIERADVVVVHANYDHSPEGQRKKRERDLRILKLDVDERPLHPFPWFNLGMTYFFLARFQEAIAPLLRSLELGQGADSTTRKAFAFLAGSQMALGDRAEARGWVERGLARYPGDPELLFRAGKLFHELGDLPRAEGCYVRLLQSPERGHIDSIDITMTTYKGRHNLAMVYQEMGRLPDAEAQWRQAVGAEPRFTPGWLALADPYNRTGRHDQLAAVREHLRIIAPEEAARLVA